MWVLPIAVGAALLSFVPASVKDWLVPSVLGSTAIFWLGNWWRGRKVRQARRRRAIDVEWLHELSEAYVNGTGRPDNIPYPLKHIEADYATYEAEFPDLEDRLTEARTALRLSPITNQLAHLKTALGEDAQRLSPPDKSRLR